MSERRTHYGLPSLAGKAAGAAVAMTAEQQAARTAAWQSIVALLAAVRGELAGQELRGLENLSSTTFPYRAAQVRKKRPWTPLPMPPRETSERDPSIYGDEVLVLDGAASLLMVCRNSGGEHRARPAAPADLVAEDMEAVAETLVYCLRQHLIRVGTATDRYRRIRQLAERLERVLETP